ncbi:bifunctional diguanylate cyclase/phosphodiesterase [Extensimonas vulgaris]|uniref:PAS domain S-box-containing protein/diguanylate cyclase (GGDEF)-like protein n=1 Tax=Extensimonas vulgaris TaxID=1031594 RepID=A0A369ALJ7_9BURK|nr:diguanylate cyclase [Extensimonas vulgaris]RCX10259.1 PAS domain S-box-containing protein/diguanylate cyclase (GGDEF)-like protein [Extensimonas vulgaris]TWI39836.1 PAS domain S-box-containing protein/diguanylate cyclase (GGDEF)-like protein [Extensimonas vulgaris]TXD17401.1 diguanylate cyclase [Extensimonas vulgaris]
MTALLRFLSHRLVWLAVLVSLGIGGLFARAIWITHADALAYAERSNANLARALEIGLVRGLDTLAEAMQNVVFELGRSKVMALPPDMRQRVLFASVARAQNIDDMLVTDERGHVVLDARGVVPRQIDLADREYFQVLRSGQQRGLYVGRPIVARTTQEWSLPLAHAYYNSDGSFAGVVVGVIPLRYFQSIFSEVQLGPDSGINLITLDGTFLARFPYDGTGVGKSVAASADLRFVQSHRSGTLLTRSTLDGVRRLYSFRRVGAYPLVVGVAQSYDTIMLPWRHNAWLLGAFAALLMAGSIGLAWLFTRQLSERERIAAQLHEAEHRLRTILDSVPSLIGYWGADLRNRFINHVCEDWFGLAPAQVAGMHLYDLIGRKMASQYQSYIEQALQGRRQVFDLSMRDARNEERHYLVAYLPDMEGGAVRGFFVQMTDITERKRMEDELFEEKERMRLTLQAIADAVVCTDAQGRVTYVNPAAERLTGWQAFDAALRDVDEVIALCAADGTTPQSSPLHQALAQKRPIPTTRGVVLQRGTGRRVDVEASASLITDRKGRVTGAVAVLRDVGAALALAERMAHLAQYDALTDLPNRLLLRERAHQAFAQARRDGSLVAVLYMDLDGFKQVNDQLGHDVGDELLVQFAKRLQSAVRATDTVCRLGGDEFLLLLPGLASAEQAAPLVCKVLNVCNAPVELAGQTLPLRVSGGMSLFPLHGQDLETLTRHADEALYAAKRSGRGRVCLYAGEGVEPALLAPAPAPGATTMVVAPSK